MSNFSAHITNINKVLKNIKSEVKADYIHSETTNIIIVTNKVASLSNLQSIEKYIKNSNQINAENIEAP